MNIDPSGVLFLDIETCPSFQHFADLSEQGKEAFEKKFRHEIMRGTYKDLEDAYDRQAPLLAEHSKVIAVGLFNTQVKDKLMDNDRVSFVGTSYCIDGPITEDNPLPSGFAYAEEITMLKALRITLDELTQADGMNPGNGGLIPCAHNGKKFDFPFLIRRYMVNGLVLPRILEVYSKKPWEISLLDTAEIWGGLNIRDSISLNSLCYALGLPSSKDDISGEHVKAAFFAGEIARIVSYCMKDTIAVHNIFCRMNRRQIYTSSV